MKKIIAILLSCAMLVTMFAAMAFTASAADDVLAFDATFDMAADGSAITLLTAEAYEITNFAWRYHASFEPTGTANTYKVVTVASPEGTDNGVTAALEVPANGFVMITYLWGTDANGIAVANKLEAGMEVVITGLDLSAKTVADDATITFPSDTAEIPANVATGKSYTTSKLYAQGDASNDWAYTEGNPINYPDENGTSLTDGIVAASGDYYNAAWAGLHAKTPDAEAAGYTWITVDLGDKYDVTSITLYGPNGDVLGGGISTLADVKFYDGEGNELGAATVTEYNAVTAAYTLEGEFEASIIEARIVSWGWNFVSEIAVEGTVCDHVVEEESSDVVEESSDVVEEESSDVVEESSDVVEESSDVVEESSDVVEESSDVVEESSDVVEESSDVVEESSDVVEESSDVVEESSDVVEESSDVVEESSDAVEEEPSIEDLVGAPNENASFTVDISAPDYKAGEQVIVTVTINGITAENGLHTVELDLYFDNSKLTVVPAEEGSSAVSAMAEFAEWEDMTKFETLEDGTVIVKVGAGTPGTSTGKFTPAVSDGQLVFNIPFIAKADAEGEINVWAPNANVKGSFINGDTGEIYEYTGNAGYVVLDEIVDVVVPETSEPIIVPTTGVATPPTSDPTDVPATGDASAMIFFAIIALVAIAGSAVVIKTRK